MPIRVQHGPTICAIEPQVDPKFPGASQTNLTPKWVKNNAGLWANGTISDNDFVHGIQYLTSNGVIKIK